MRRAGCRLVRLRVVDENKIRPDRPAVWAGVPQAADAAGDAGDSDGGPGGDPAGDGRQRDLVGVPLDLRRLAVDRLPASPLVDPLEGADRVGRVREVVRQEIVLLEVRFDRVEHLLGDRLVGADNHDELPMTVQQCPNRRPLAQRRFAGAARHGKREQLAAEDGALDLGDRGQMVGRPRKGERLRGVRLAERPEVNAGAVAAGRIADWRRRPDVAAGGRHAAGSLFAARLDVFVSAGIPLFLRPIRPPILPVASEERHKPAASEMFLTTLRAPSKSSLSRSRR